MSRVIVNFSRAYNRLDKARDKAQYVLANQVLADSNNYVPELSGDLKRYAVISNDNKSITWNQPYARFQYYANGTFNYTKPGTGPKWDEVAKRNHMSSWRKLAGREYR